MVNKIKRGMSMYCKGSKRKGQHLKKSIGLMSSEGKHTMSKELYALLAKMHLSKKGRNIYSSTRFFFLVGKYAHTLFNITFNIIPNILLLACEI